MITKEKLEQLRVGRGDIIKIEDINGIIDALIEILDRIEEMEHDISMLELKK